MAVKQVKKILINCITMDRANLVPLCSKISYWSIQNISITIIGSQLLKQRLIDEMSCYVLEFIEVGNGFEISSKIIFVIQCIIRNIRGMMLLRTLKGQFDIVYSISSVLDLLIIPYALKCVDSKIVWVTIFDNLVTLKGTGKKSHRLLAVIFFKISLFFIKKADRVCAISDELKDYLSEFGVANEKLLLTGNAVQGELIRQAEAAKIIEYDALFVGRINDAKGIYDMVEVLKLIRSFRRHFILAIMGEGDLDTFSRYKKYIDKTGMEKNIIFLGQKTGLEKFKIFKKSRSFWFLSENESFGVALLEAVCCGLPAFAYNLLPYEKIYLHGEVVISPKGDFRDVAKNVLALFESGRFENAAGVRLLEKYRWESIAEMEIRFL